MGVGLDAYRAEIGEMLAPMTRIAAHNPHAWYRLERTAAAVDAAGDVLSAYSTYDGGPTLAEGLEGAVSERTFQMARDYFPEIALVSEVAIRQAIV